ncbi:MAG TPA: DUF2093 domain-containing protein [Hyphomonadaceae bacterium]|jgi:hypothetical protein|nr:DUF2093 domain-containing protein [Hyphomonadaceae bacterium]
MDAFTPGSLPGEAKLRYKDCDLEILKDGNFVVCAVTRKKIPVEDLRYWNVDLQEAYFDAETALTRWKQVNGRA